jgi:predicted patatin/cPLA2 family phospholipase
MVRVRASSTLPIMMPPPCIDGVWYYDGGFASGGGLPLRRIEEDGFEKVLVVRTRQRGYRREDGYAWAHWALPHRPYLREALLKRAEHYNEACDLLDQWERDGRAYVFYCDDLTLTGMEHDFESLGRNFEAGYAQIQRDWPKVEKFLEHAEA